MQFLMDEIQMTPRTLFEKIWETHIVRAQTPETPAVLYIDLHLIHEVTSPQAFTELRERGLKVRRPDRTLATMDHSTPTTPRGPDGIIPVIDPQAIAQLNQLERNCADFGIPLVKLGTLNQGIVHVLATQCLLQSKPKTMAIRVDGRLQNGVTAKDIILAIIAKIGVGGGTGHVVEYMGEAIRALSMEERMTICNMSIEGGARAGLVAPDETTFNYIAGKPHAPKGADWDAAVAAWRQLPSDDGAAYDAEVTLDANTLTPMITYGTNPGMGMPIDGRIPTPSELADPSQRTALDKALRYMNLEPGQPLLGHKIDMVFIGSCTNSRISDLRQAAGLIKGRTVAPGVRVMVVPGSQRVKRQAEEEGLDEVFKAAGAEWREAGCSACLAMNDDKVPAGKYAVSTSNRNFQGRQGPGARTLLASPITAAAAAVTGVVTDPRELLS